MLKTGLVLTATPVGLPHGYGAKSGLVLTSGEPGDAASARFVIGYSPSEPV